MERFISFIMKTLNTWKLWAMKEENVTHSCQFLELRQQPFAFERINDQEDMAVVITAGDNLLYKSKQWWIKFHI